MKNKLPYRFYLQSVELAKDTSTIFGIDSEEHKQSIIEMQRTYKLCKIPFQIKVLNLITRIKWLTKKQRY